MKNVQNIRNQHIRSQRSEILTKIRTFKYDSAIELLQSEIIGILKITKSEITTSTTFSIDYPNRDLIGLADIEKGILTLNLLEVIGKNDKKIIISVDDVERSIYLQDQEAYVIYSLPTDPDTHFSFYTETINPLEFELIQEYFRLTSKYNDKNKNIYNKMLNVKNI